MQHVFGGLGHLLRITPSRKNPHFCTSCLDRSPEGVHAMEIGVLFADIRGFTAWSSSQPAAAAPSEIVVAETAFHLLTVPPEGAQRRLLEVKGKPEALPVYVLQAD